MKKVRLHVVDEATSIAHQIQGPTHCVSHCARPVVFRENFPHLLDTKAIVLRRHTLSQIELLHDLFTQGASAAFSQDGLLRKQFHAWFKGILFLAILSNAHISQLHTGHRAICCVHRGISRKTCVDFHAHSLGLFTQPTTQLAERDDVVSLLPQLWRQVQQGIGHRDCQVFIGKPVEGVAGHRRIKWSPSFFPVRQKLLQSSWFEDISRQDVSTHLSTFLDDTNVELLSKGLCPLLSANGGCQTSRASSHDQEIKLHRLS
mmetsp:Transcript_2173/g.5016  ORF Transcript_2173/g.5016 Transcript_2173/m.5016 type:complete len:260 (+) Transcript_2173:950-1729(+)